MQARINAGLPVAGLISFRVWPGRIIAPANFNGRAMMQPAEAGMCLGALRQAGRATPELTWNRTLPGETCRRHVEPRSREAARQGKFLLGGAGGTSQQKRSNGPADQLAGWARGGCGGTCRGQVSPAATGCRLCRPRQARSGWRVTPPLSCFPFFGVIWAFGAKTAEVP